jgi:hypothetical protein
MEYFEVEIPQGCRRLLPGECMKMGDLWLNFAWEKWEFVSSDFVGLLADHYMVVRSLDSMAMDKRELTHSKAVEIEHIEGNSYYDENGLKMTYVTCDVCGKVFQEVFRVAWHRIRTGDQHRCINHDPAAAEPALARVTIKTLRWVFNRQQGSGGQGR